MKKQVIKDFAYNIISSFLTIGILQLIVYPILAKVLGGDVNGQMLTLMGIINTAASLGNALNNVRLIRNTDYADDGIEGDFNPINIAISLASGVAIFFIGRFAFGTSILISVTMAVLAILTTARTYLIVIYRLNLNFKNNLICHVIMGGGYLLGIGLVFFVKVWPIAFICGELASIVWIAKTTCILREKNRLTKAFGTTMSKLGMLAAVTVIGNVMVYLDKLIIYPIFGGEAVSVYAAASFFGKALGLVMTPIAGVMLGYFASKNYVMTFKKFWQSNFIVLALTAVFFGCSLFAAPIAIKLLYPQFYEEAMVYVFMANLAAMIGVMANMAQPAVLKFAPTYWQIVKEVVYSVFYLAVGFWLIPARGMMGFCIASVAAQLSRLLILYGLGTFYFSKNRLTRQDESARSAS